MIFNIFYINFPKVYEIKMMLNNVISIQKEIEKEATGEGDINLKGKLGLNILEFFKLGEIEGSGNIKGAGSRKVLETFETKTTKSIILSEVVEKAKQIKKIDNIKEGELVLIDDVKLSLENEDELRVVKFINSGAFKDMMIPGANGLDMNNLFNSMFKDYAYKIKGKLIDEEANILVKIPLTFESEFESSYGVDDLFVGKVSIVGLYKGKIKIDDLKNSFEYFQEFGQFQNVQKKTNEEEDEIQNSHYVKSKPSNNAFYFKSSGDGKDYHYIDLLAIIQNVKIDD